MKFKYYIFDSDQGRVFGTNDPDVAHDFSTSFDYFVISPCDNEWITDSGEVEQIKDIDSNE